MNKLIGKRIWTYGYKKEMELKKLGEDKNERDNCR